MNDYYRVIIDPVPYYRRCTECNRILAEDECTLCTGCKEEGQEAEEYMYWEEED